MRFPAIRARESTEPAAAACTARSRVDVAERGLADGANEPTTALPSSPRALLAAFRASSSAAMASGAHVASSGRQRLAEVCGSAAGDAESMPAGEREGRAVTPQTLSHRGSVVNFCVGGKLGRSAKKTAPSFWSLAPI